MTSDELREQLVRIEERQIALGQKVEDLDEKLFGNGQPGIITRLSERIVNLEIRFWMALGGVVVLAWIAERIWG